MICAPPGMFLKSVVHALLSSVRGYCCLLMTALVISCDLTREVHCQQQHLVAEWLVIFTERILTLLSSTGISHVNQSDWDDKSLAIGSAAYGNSGGERRLWLHSADGIFWEAGEAAVCLLLFDSNVGRSRYHLKIYMYSEHVSYQLSHIYSNNYTVF